MVVLPESLRRFQKAAEPYLTNDRIGEIHFSGSTYQVQFREKNREEVWAFLQLDPSGSIQDSFCSCHDGSNLSVCAHIAAAWLRIYRHPQPLHLRFQESLWNYLCKFCLMRLGDQPQVLTKLSPGYYVYQGIGDTPIFSVKATGKATKDQLKELLEERRAETEENSIKFSNLSLEELEDWRAGKPSDQLRYDLSFWSDLAHWMMRLQEEEISYNIAFKCSAHGLPNFITLSFPALDIGFFISESNLETIIPALTSVNSPLKVYETSLDSIRQMTYDKVKGILNISQADEAIDFAADDGQKKGVKIGRWLFVPGKGFYSQHDYNHLFNTTSHTEALDKALTHYTDWLRGHVKNVKIHKDQQHLSYKISFDTQWNLHLTSYLFQPGDLSTPYARLLFNWIYVEDDGFYPLKESHFQDIEHIIPAHAVSDFVSSERGWLNSQPGFGTHLTSVESQITYEVDAQKRLSFHRISKSSASVKDFGSWVYVAGQGFYAKVNTAINLPIGPNLSIHAEQIPLFIRANRTELEAVPQFFSESCPIESIELEVTLEAQDQILIAPHFKRLTEYANKEVHYFGEFTYVLGEGFYELPPILRLPESFAQPIQINPIKDPAFLEEQLPRLRSRIHTLDPRLIIPQQFQLLATAINKVQEGGYDLNLFYQTEQGRVSVVDLWHALKKKKRFLFTEAGCLDLTHKRWHWIKLLSPKQVRRPNILHLSTLELIRLYSLQILAIDLRAPKGPQADSTLKELIEFQVPKPPDLVGLQSTLWHYQQLGIQWLWFLRKHELSGLLCDEMGLGKTHQAMALIAAIVNDAKNQGYPIKPFLIICPTSVIYHWEEKLQQTLPHLRICSFHGINRSHQNLSSFDVILTSYGIWRLEHKNLNSLIYELAILDEVQIAKNHKSKIHAALKKINTTMRLGMTGTPIENQLREMKALFDLVLPGYMPGEREYRELFIKPIEKEGDRKQRNLLAQFVRPFVLRRKKEDVLPDLPEKIEEIAHCDLALEQLAIYNQILQRSKAQVLSQLQDGDSPIPYIHIFAILTSLKQICDHPAVFYKTPSEYKKYQSGKWDLFIELLNEARESQQKVVIFSQYLGMLDIFEKYLNEQGINFATIRGTTMKRGNEIKRFNKDPDCTVFLGSLRASGLGVDLTAGSVVIHYDRWWNAAREEQATDRVHRIGQTRGVQVFKLVTKGTLEEHIDQLIARKGRLMEEVVQTDDHRFLKSFSRQELMILLQEVGDTKPLA